MSDSISGRPKSVTTIGWVCIVIGAVMLFNAAIVLTANLMIKTFGTGDTSSTPFNTSPGFPGPVSFAFAHFSAFAGLQVLLAIALIYFAAMLLRLKSWARSALEIMSWGSLAALVVFWGSILATMLGGVSASSSQHPASGAYASAAIVLVISGFFTLIVVFAIVLLLKGLRRKEVREACSR